MTALVRLLRRNLEVLPGLIVFLFLVTPYWLSIPVWDGEGFAACIRGAAHESFRWGNFLCFEHPSILFISLFSIPENFFPNSIFLMHTMMFALGAASIVAFHTLCRLLFPHASRLTRVLCILLYAAQPVIIANVIDVNLDNGVLFFFVILLALLFYGHEKWAALIGLMMVFTKESGVLLYGLTLISYWTFVVRRQHRFLPSALKAGLQRWWFLLPILLYSFHTLWQKHLGNAMLHEGRAPHDVLRGLLSIEFLHERFLTVLTTIFLFQFTWFQTAMMLSALLLWFWRRDLQRHHHSDRFPHLGFIIFLFLAGVYFLTRLVPWINIRYMMPLFPLSILLFTASVVAITRNQRIVHGLLIVAVLLNALAMFRSVDPVSIALLKTFSFGSRTMYALGDYDICCLRGRDQLVYNMEYQNLFLLQDRAFKRIRPDASTYIAFPKDANRGHHSALHPVTFHRTWSSSGIVPAYMTIDNVPSLNPLPDEFFFIDLPNFPAENQKKQVEEKYDIASFEEIEQSGYSIGLIKYVLKPSSLQALPKKK